MQCRFWLCLIAGALIVSCSSSNFNPSGGYAPAHHEEASTPKSQKANQEPVLVSNQDSRKTSDDSEGVPGYLVSPESVTAAADTTQGSIDLNGPDATVEAGRGYQRDRLNVLVWAIDAGEFTKKIDAATAAIELQATLLVAIRVTDTGAFSGKVSGLKAGQAVVLSVSGAKSEAKLKVTLPRGKRFGAIYRAPYDKGQFVGARPAVAVVAAPPTVDDTTHRDKIAGIIPENAKNPMYNCLNDLYGSDWKDADIGSYRQVAQIGTATVSNYVFSDPKTDKPELVHILINATTINGVKLDLSNPKATYCLDIQATALAGVTINIACFAHFDENSTATLKRNIAINRVGC